MSAFQNMLTTMMGPDLRPGQAGRSGPDTLFGEGPNFQTYNGRTPDGHRVTGGRFTFQAGNLPPRDADGPPAGGLPIDTYEPLLSRLPPIPPSGGGYLVIISRRDSPDEHPRILATLFSPMGGGPAHNHDHQHDEDHDHDPNDPHNQQNGGPDVTAGLPPALRTFFQAMLNPVNARSGDAVYSQEALDQIISTLMEQNPTSTAPGPAPPDAIAALPKKNLDEKMLGPEGKADCPVCMDDVHLGDEVVCLPCSHWFHETCASAWLGEHNTCPICRKGIDGVDGSTAPQNRRASASNLSSGFSQQTRRMSFGTRERLSRSNTTSGRSETERRNHQARLDAIRNSGRLTPTQESPSNSVPPHSWSNRASSNYNLDPGSERSREESSRSPNISGAVPLFPRPRYSRQDTGNSRSSRDSEQRAQRRGSQQGSARGSESRSEGGGGGGPFAWFRNQLRGSGDRRR